MAELMRRLLISLIVMLMAASACSGEKSGRGVVVYPSDIISIGLDGWEQRIRESGINLVGIHAATFNEPLDTLRDFVQSPLGQDFLALCRKMHVDVEYELHVLQLLLPRDLFETHPEYFRQGQSGQRQKMYNMCFTCDEAYEALRPQLKEMMSWMHPTTHRYFLWPDDVKGTFCNCGKCGEYTPSEQALIFENRLLAMIREYDPKATLAHLAYNQTIDPPVKVKPDQGVFLEFAPISRDYTQPLSSELEGALRTNLEVFPAATAHILEYWLDESMFSSWKRGALVELPFNEQACRRDINLYRNFGVASITSFATWLGGPYVEKYGPADWAFESYGRAFSNGTAEESFRIRRKAMTVEGFHAPWDGKDDDTRLTMWRDADSLYFRFDVSENTLTLAQEVSSESDIEPEDRIELFFSATDDMSTPYYGIEIDPAGNILDYKVGYYRKFDYGWTFPGVTVKTSIAEGGYCVEAHFSRRELEALGIGRKFWLGAFRDDFLPDGSVVWYSRRPTSDKEPDFHKPDILISAKI